MTDVRIDDLTRTVYSTDNSIYQVRPAAVALPDHWREIQELLRENAELPSPRPVVARGGGTGTNGQSLTDGLVVDLKRKLNRVIDIDPHARTATVEPGVVTAQLNATLSEHGLYWAPHTSTLNRATVGGMISTDAAGKGSLVHGRAHRHVASLRMLLDDGTEWVAEPVTVDEAHRRASADDRGGQLWRALLDLPIAEADDFGLPELARGFSGYGIDRLRRDGLVDPIALVCGAEGTLGIITQATLRLTPKPAETLLLVASYDTFAEALDDALDLTATAPSAIESFDEMTLERGRSSPSWPALGSVVGEDRCAVLLLEYEFPLDGESPGPDQAAIEAALAATGRSRAVQALTNPADQAAAWKVRADAVGLLAKVATGGPELSARPVAFVEDCAVPVANMSAFIAEFRQVLDDAGVTYGMFGHADVGCVHVRPALDLTDPDHEAKVRRITDDVVAAVGRHGGVLWGEHGRGFRGDSVESFLPPETIAIMEQVKAAFDPHDVLNPGKLYRPAGATSPIVAVDEAPLRGHSDRSVPVEIRRDFDDAFACNGNGACHTWVPTDVMCPSYKATGDPALSPRARANLLRSWLSERSTAGKAAVTSFEDDIAENLSECLSCSACSGLCPVEVDIPELKSRFLERYYESRQRPLSHRVLAQFESLATTAARIPLAARFGSGPAGKALGLVDLPAPSARKRHTASAFEPASSAGAFDLVIMPDVFTSALESATLAAAVKVLQSLDYRVGVAPFVASGKYEHVKGMRDRFGQAVAAQSEMVHAIAEEGAVPVVIEPAVALLHKAEYSHYRPSHDGTSVRHLAEVIDERRDRLGLNRTAGAVKLLGHCTERATGSHVLAAWQRVLTAAGYEVSTPNLGCCGMAGIFGHEAENQGMSRKLWDMTWASHIAEPSRVVATGYSCRSQAKRFGGRAVPHPIQLLA